MLQLALWLTLTLNASDAPAAEPAEPPAQTQDSAALQPRELPFGYHFAAGAVAAAVAVPASLYLGSFFAQTSNNYIVAAIPIVLSIGLIPPIAVTVATVLAGNWRSPGKYRWWPAFLATLAINGISLPIAASLGPVGLTVGVAERVILYTLVQAVLQPGAAVLLERSFPKQDQPTVITVNDPVAPTTWMVPAQAWSF